MFEPLLEQSHDMLVVERVEHHLPRPPGPNEPQTSQQAELVRNGRLAQAKELGDISHAELPVGEGVENADASDVSECLEDFGQGLCGLTLQEASLQYMSI